MLPTQLHSARTQSELRGQRARHGCAIKIRRSGAGTAASVFCIAFLLISLTFTFAEAEQSLPDAPRPKNAATQTKAASETAWPGTISSVPNTFTVYQPQVDKWEGDLVDLYCAVELKAGPERAAKYGVVWFQARTEVDKLNRLVRLNHAKVTTVKFPVAGDNRNSFSGVPATSFPIR